MFDQYLTMPPSRSFKAKLALAAAEKEGEEPEKKNLEGKNIPIDPGATNTDVQNISYDFLFSNL
jgi:hypothetical protein